MKKRVDLREENLLKMNQQKTIERQREASNGKTSSRFERKIQLLLLHQSAFIHSL